MDDAKAGKDSKNDSSSGCLIRFAWMAVANMAIFFAAMNVMQAPAMSVSWGDWAIIAAVLLSVVARYLDIRFFAGETADGDPATMTDWRRHIVLIVVVGAAALAVAHAIAAAGWLQ